MHGKKARLVSLIVLTLTVVFGLAAVSTQSAQAQTYELLHSFRGSPDGSLPSASMILDSKGNFYGTTEGGGNEACNYYGPHGQVQGCGTVFKLDAGGRETVLYTFAGGTDGANPAAGVIRDSEGNLYGTTASGGAYANGTVFKVTKAGVETVLHAFTGGSDGAVPLGGLIEYKGNLYGTTFDGGVRNGGCGVVFRVSKTGKETVLYTFCLGNSDLDGAQPAAGLIRDAKGNLYGTTEFGGAGGVGTVFKLTKAGKETVLYNFCSQPSCTDGEFPSAGVVMNARGNLYGTTFWGGTQGCYQGNGCGVVFELSKAGTETVLYTFCPGGNSCADGAWPSGGLIEDATGNIYGTTSQGGASNWGAVFKLSPTGTENVLYSFTGTADGAYPFAGVIQDAKGRLYGSAYGGGDPGCATFGCGTVWKLTP